MFEVIWTDAALDELADAWVRLGPAARDAVEQAVIALNARLAEDPTLDSESRPDGLKFWVSRAEMKVRVGHFWTHRRLT